MLVIYRGSTVHVSWHLNAHFIEYFLCYYSFLLLVLLIFLNDMINRFKTLLCVWVHYSVHCITSDSKILDPHLILNSNTCTVYIYISFVSHGKLYFHIRILKNKQLNKKLHRYCFVSCSLCGSSSWHTLSWQTQGRVKDCEYGWMSNSGYSTWYATYSE